MGSIIKIIKAFFGIFLNFIKRYLFFIYYPVKYILSYAIGMFIYIGIFLKKMMSEHKYIRALRIYLTKLWSEIKTNIVYRIPLFHYFLKIFNIFYNLVYSIIVPLGFMVFIVIFLFYSDKLNSYDKNLSKELEDNLTTEGYDIFWKLINQIYKFVTIKSVKNKLLFIVIFILALTFFILYNVIVNKRSINIPFIAKINIGTIVGIIASIVSIILSLELFRFREVFNKIDNEDEVKNLPYFKKVIHYIFVYTPWILTIFSFVLLIYSIGIDNIRKYYCMLTTGDTSRIHKTLCGKMDVKEINNV